MLGRLLDVFRRQYLGALALFVALGGTSYAAVTLERGSVGSRELRNGSVGGRGHRRRGGEIPPDRRQRRDGIEDRARRDQQR